MPAKHIACSECGTIVPNPSGKRKTCSDRCRATRTRRIAADKKRASHTAHPPELKEASEGLDPERREDILGEVLRAEAAPVIREEIGDHLQSLVQQVVGLAPKALAALELALASSDARVASRAAEILLKYTMPPADKDRDNEGGNVEINFTLPRAPDEHTDEETIEVQACDVCNVEKPLTEFVDGSTRCGECHAAIRAQVEERFHIG